MTPANPPTSAQTSVLPSSSSSPDPVQSSSEPTLHPPTVEHDANAPLPIAGAGLVTSDTEHHAEQQANQVDVPDEDQPPVKTFPGLNDEQPNRRWQSKTTRVTRLEIKPEDIVWLRQNDGSITGYARDFLLDQFGSVKDRKRVIGPSGKAITVILTEQNGLIVLDDTTNSTQTFETLELARKAGYEV